MSIISLSEEEVANLLTWPLVYDAVEQALRAVPETRTSEAQPTANQPARIVTSTGKGLLLTMPGFIGNYRLKHTGQDDKRVLNTLACKMVSSFEGNEELSPPIPRIIGTICVFGEDTGELKAIVGGTAITAWRTAAASIVSTNYLYLQRSNVDCDTTKQVSIIGCGVQGRIHAIGLCSLFNVARIRLWNRTKPRAESLAAELEQMRKTFVNPGIQIICSDTVEHAVASSDIIVTATFTRTPLIYRSMLNDNVHINAVGAGQNHHSELSDDVYNDPKTRIFVDNNSSAKTELAPLNAPIVGEVGDVINGAKQTPIDGITIFHSMGMAVEDAVVAEAVVQKHLATK